MALDRPNRRLFIGCRSKVMAVMNADTGQVITTLPIGDHVDATAFDPETRLIFNSNGEGTVTVIRQESPDKYSVVDNVKTLPRAKTLALDPKTHQFFCRQQNRDSLKSWLWGSNPNPGNLGNLPGWTSFTARLSKRLRRFEPTPTKRGHGRRAVICVQD